MRELGDGYRLVEHAGELPDLRGAARLYADFETTSGDDRLDSLNPWHRCWTAGVAVTADDVPGAWYVPVRHRSGVCLPTEVVSQWWLEVLGSCRRWSNHNVKYDAHVSANDLGVLPGYDVELWCSLTHAKVVDSDRGHRGGYGLDALSLGWLGEDVRPLEAEVKRWLGESRDYGSVPPHVMTPYACQDVISVRRLEKYVEQRRHQECDLVASIETRVTRALFDTERAGMVVDPDELDLALLELLQEYLDLDAELAGIVGRSVNVQSSDQLYDLLCNQYGLPVLGWTEEDEDGQPAGNPSFDKEALAKYAQHPYAPARVIELVTRMRKLMVRKSLFIEPYRELAVLSPDGHWRLHPTYNQTVRTGRMSCKEPNQQQLDEWAKALVHPARGCSLMSADQSQVEFRIIAHYVQNRAVIDSYARDPDTDFHQWMAETAGMSRRPAKTLNFMMGYGGGKKKAVRSLSINKDVVGTVKELVEQRVAAGEWPREREQELFEAVARKRAEDVYDSYHRTLPELKPTSRRAAAVCADRGYVRNLHGRHRHLPREAAHKAFNSLCQGEAADVQKETTAELHRRLLGTPLEMCGNVHDATVIHGPTEALRDPRTVAAVAYVLENPPSVAGKLRVPLRCSVGVSERDWCEADKTSAPVHYSVGGPDGVDPEDPFRHLR